MPDPINPWKGLKPVIALALLLIYTVPDPINPWKGLKREDNSLVIGKRETVPDPINPWKGLKL